MASLKSLLLTKTEIRKLFFEIWKYLLLAILGGIALLSPAIRSGLASLCASIWKFNQKDTPLRGWIIIVLSMGTLLALVGLGRRMLLFIQGAYVRRFTSGHFDGIDWTWRWKKRRVNRSSMVPLCPKCQTQLILEQKENANGGLDTTIFCTSCNSSFGITNVSNLQEHVSHKIEGEVRSGRWKARLSKNSKHDNLPKKIEEPAPEPSPARASSRSDEEDRILLQLTNGQRRPAHNIAYRIGISSDRADVILEGLREADFVNRQEFARLEFEDQRPPDWYLTTAGKRYLAERNLIR